MKKTLALVALALALPLSACADEATDSEVDVVVEEGTPADATVEAADAAADAAAGAADAATDAAGSAADAAGSAADAAGDAVEDTDVDVTVDADTTM